MENNNSIKTLQSAIPVTKQEIQMLAVEIIQQLDNGEISGLELLKQFKMIERTLEIVKDKLIKTALKEADKYPEKEIEKYGVIFKKAEVGTKYSYEGCNDEVFVEIEKQEKLLKEEKEKRATFLKSIDGSLTVEVVDEGTGEVTTKTLYPPVKTSTSSVTVTIK